MKSSAWKEQWIADIRARARVEVPRWLRSIPASRLEPLPLPRPQQTENLVRLEHAGNTEPIPKTVSIPIVRLLPEDETRALVSEAVRWFWQRRHCLPEQVGLNPLRCLAIRSQRYFPIECEDIGAFTIEVCAVAELARDVVMVVGQVVSVQGGRYVWGNVTDFYL